jgi:hypothetical protein
MKSKQFTIKIKPSSDSSEEEKRKLLRSCFDILLGQRINENLSTNQKIKK